MKTLLTILSVLVCAVCLGQTKSDQKPSDYFVSAHTLPQVSSSLLPRNGNWSSGQEYQPIAIDTTYSYHGFTAYLVIQTSEVTKEQIDFAKKLTKYVKDQHGILYITIQSGTPPCVPSPGHPCPPPR